MKNTGICIISLVGGMVVGSALAMLLTPQSGPELRHQIKHFMEEEMAKAKERAEQIKGHLREEMATPCCHEKGEM